MLRPPRLRGAAFAAVLPLFLAAPCHAQDGKPRPDLPIPLDDRNAGKLALALKEKCPDEYGDLSAQQRGRIVAAFKQVLKLTIGIYIEDDGNECNPMIGAALSDFCDSRKKKVNVVIDFGQTEPVVVRPDGSAAATPRDTVSISGKVFKRLPGIMDAKDYVGPDAGRPLPDTFNAAYRRMFVDLMGEALRIKQVTAQEGVHECIVKFRNDLEVTRRKLDIEKDAKEDLMQFIDDDFPFTDAKYGLNRRLFRRIQEKPPEQRKAAAEAILRYLCDSRIPALERELLEEWEKFKKKFGIDKDRGVDRIDETLAEMIELKVEPVNFELWTDPSKKVAFFALPEGFSDPDTEFAYLGGGGTFDFGGDETEAIGDTTIVQVAPGSFETSSLEVTGVDHVYHAALADGGESLLVLGGIDATGEGLLIGYNDDDDDGFFEAATRTESLRSFDIYGGARFLSDPGTGAMLIFSRAPQSLYELGHSGGAGHGFPDMLEFRGSLGFQRFDLEHAGITRDGLSLWATGHFDAPFGPATLVPYSVASSPGGEFVPVDDDDYQPFNDDEREPIALRRPVVGDAWARASGRPGATLVAYEVSGGMFSLGAASVDAEGTATIPLSRPLQATDIIRFQDATTSESSPDHPAIPLSFEPVITSARFVSYGKFLINFEGVPGFGATFGSSVTLTLPFEETSLPLLDDIGTSYYEADVVEGSAFFRIGTFNPEF